MAKRYKCPYCDIRLDRARLIKHVDKNHVDFLPEGFTPAQAVYDSINHTNGHGKCRVCGRPTKWNGFRYDVLCGDPKCKEKLREDYKKNMLRVRGTYNILSDPEQQIRMLAARKISGKYKHSDGGIIDYTGEYERKFLEFIDVYLQIPSADIMSPGPTMEYTYKGQKHIYIPDFYYIPMNLIIEIKDGGENPNMRVSDSMTASREKTIEKERVVTNRGVYNYIRLTNNAFEQLIDVFMAIKEKLLNDDESTTVRIHESYEDHVIASFFSSDDIPES